MSSMAITRSTTRSEARPASGDLRLTRRGRLVVFATLLAAVCAALVTVAGTAIGSGEAGRPVPTRTVVVHSGDTLWEIAQDVAPGEDPREVIAEIQDLNTIEGGIRSGDELAVPTDW